MHFSVREVITTLHRLGIPRKERESRWFHDGYLRRHMGGGIHTDNNSVINIQPDFVWVRGVLTMIGHCLDS